MKPYLVLSKALMAPMRAMFGSSVEYYLEEPIPMRTPESWEKSDIDKYLRSIGAYVVKPTTGGFGGSGHSDRICCIHGRFWGIEVKREGKGPTVLQARRMQEIEEAGGFAVWGTAEKVIRTIEAWLKSQTSKPSGVERGMTPRS